MDTFTVKQIGTLRCGESGFRIELDRQFAPALTGIDGFSHLQVVWWFSRCDNPQCRAVLTADSPYKKSPDVLGIFPTRSPLRPNPVALSCAEVTYVDHEDGCVGLAWIDAEDGSPVLDIKPYTPSLDRVEKPGLPGWCAHWPGSVEASGDFDWEDEFNF